MSLDKLKEASVCIWVDTTTVAFLPISLYWVWNHNLINNSRSYLFCTWKFTEVWRNKNSMTDCSDREQWKSCLFFVMLKITNLGVFFTSWGYEMNKGYHVFISKAEQLCMCNSLHYVTYCICKELGTYSIVLSFTLCEGRGAAFHWPTHSKQETKQYSAGTEPATVFRIWVYKLLVYYPFKTWHDV